VSLPQPDTRAVRRREVPPVVGWWDWYVPKVDEIYRRMHPRGPAEQHGMHFLFVGPTQSGKTLLCRFLVELRDFVVTLGTKPKDPSLDDYIADGFLRIDHWPPTKADVRKGEERWPAGKRWFLVWPKIVRREDLRRFRPLFKATIEDVFAEGMWTLVADEGLWLGSRDGLALGQELSDLAYGSASNGVSMYLLMQRPSGLPRITWSSVMAAELFHMGITSDIRELASLGTYEPADVARAIRALRGYQFLDLPIRSGADWAVSQVDLSAHLRSR
jgi:hypothetical protein